MDQLVILNGQEQQQLVRAIESAVHVRRRHQLFLWAQGQLYGLLPHEILVCLRLERGNGATNVECLHSMVFDEEQDDRLCHPHTGLAVRLARSCEESGLLPSMLDDGFPPHGRLYQAFRVDMEKAGLRNAVVHGHRVSGHSDASFFLLFNVEGHVAPLHGHLMQILLPHLHMAFHHVIGQGRPQADEPGAAAALPITSRELQILQWVCGGKSNHEISVILEISPLTVKNHMQKIFRKLQVNNRAQAVSKAMALKIFPMLG